MSIDLWLGRRIQMREHSKILKGRARNALHNRYGTPMLALAVMVFVYVLISSPFNYSLLIAQKSSSLIIYVIANILIFTVFFEIMVGFNYIHLLIARNTKPKLRDLLFAFKNRPDRFLPVILIRDGIYFICLLPSFVTMFLPVTYENLLFMTMLSTGLTLAGAIVGLIITTRFALADYLMIDNPQMKGIDAIKESMRLMKGQNSHLLYIYFSFIGYVILAFMSFNLGFLWVIPYITETNTCLYLESIGEPFYMDIEKSPIIDVEE